MADWHCDICNRVMSANGKSGHERSRDHLRLKTLKYADPDDLPTIIDAMPEGEAQKMRAELDRLRAEVEKLRSENKDLTPFYTWPVFKTPEDVREFLGPEKLRESAESMIVAQDRDRGKRGLPPQWSTDRASYEVRIEKLIDEICKEAVDDASKWTRNLSKSIRMRTIKMVKTDGTMIQVPVEPQINNGAGSIADPIERYKRKGYKMASPVRCALRDCFAEAANSGGRMTLGGYCSPEHLRHVEGKTAQSLLRDGESVSVFDATLAG